MFFDFRWGKSSAKATAFKPQTNRITKIYYRISIVQDMLVRLVKVSCVTIVQHDRVERYITKEVLNLLFAGLRRAGYLPVDFPSFEKLALSADDGRFRSISSNPDHVLRH